MLKKDPNFRRLKVGGWGWFGHTSYWLGSDHLLVVEVANFTERYRRFYFRDIQAVLVQVTRARLFIFLLLLVPLLLFLAVLVAAAVDISQRPMQWDDWAALAFWGTPCIGFLICMLLNYRRGVTCSVHLRTAVQTQKLMGLSRWRAAEKFIAELQPSPVTHSLPEVSLTSRPQTTPPAGAVSET
jgi:uncharacterized integral membrane protein